MYLLLREIAKIGLTTSMKKITDYLRSLILRNADFCVISVLVLVGIFFNKFLLIFNDHCRDSTNCTLKKVRLG